MDKSKIIAEGITFDDVLLMPARSDLVPSQADTRTRLTTNITINIPLVSAAMDTVTEASLAIALAQVVGLRGDLQVAVILEAAMPTMLIGMELEALRR